MALAKFGTADMAQLLGVSPRRIQQLVAQGVFVREARGLFDGPSTVQSYVAFRERTLITEVGGSGEYGKARLALIKEKIAAAKFDREIRLRDWLPTRGVVAITMGMTVVFKNKLLGIGASTAPSLAAEKSPAKCRAIVDARIFEALTELAKMGDVVIKAADAKLRAVPSKQENRDDEDPEEAA
jgi:hypothetical protein